MSTDIIQANYEQLADIASRFASQAEGMEALLRRLQQASDVLEHGDWEGRGIAAFGTEMNSVLYPAMQRLNDAFQQAQRVTLEVSQAIAAAEEEAARPFLNGEAESIGAGGSAGASGGAESSVGAAGAEASSPADPRLQPKPTSEIFSESYMEGMIGQHFQGEDSPELNSLMETLSNNPTGEELNQTLDRIADIRGVPREQFRAQYERFLDLQKQALATNGVPDPIDLDKHGDFLGTTASLRYGKVVGDALGVDPVFGALLNPTGGLVGPGNTAYAPGDNDPIGYHGIFHDAAGYLFNYHDSGPGYDYLGQESSRPTSDPLTGQLSGTRWWLQHRELDAPGPDIIVENPLFYGPLRGVGTVLIDGKRIVTDTADGFRNLFDGNWGRAGSSLGSATVGAVRLPINVAITGVETVVDTGRYVGENIVDGTKAVGRFFGGLF